MQAQVPITKVCECIEPIENSLLFKPCISIHVLRDGTAVVQISFDTKNQEELLVMDNLTSRVIKNGGTLRTENRASLDAISPYLAKRILGTFNLPLQESIKKAFDPHDVLCSNRLFW